MTSWYIRRKFWDILAYMVETGESIEFRSRKYGITFIISIKEDKSASESAEKTALK